MWGGRASSSSAARGPVTTPTGEVIIGKFYSQRVLLALSRHPLLNVPLHHIYPFPSPS